MRVRLVPRRARSTLFILMKRIFVTSCAAAASNHTCMALANANLGPIPFEDLSRGHARAGKGRPLIQEHLRYRHAGDHAIAEVLPLIEMFFTAYSYVGSSVAEPSIYLRSYFPRTLNLLDFIRWHSAGCRGRSDTCDTSGRSEKLPLTEGYPQRTIYSFGELELIAEGACADCTVAHGLRAVSHRYFNAMGADAIGKFGERHYRETQLIPLVLADAQWGLPVTVYGDDHNTPDRTCIREDVHVSHLSKAHIHVLQSLRQSEKSAAKRVTGVGDGTKFIDDGQWGIWLRDICAIIDRSSRLLRTDYA